MLDIKRTYRQFGYSNQILNTGHACGSIADTMKIIQIEKK
jgi:hypothetical protein